MPVKWKTVHPQRDWQRRALSVWAERQRGVVGVVTGAGKTMFAMQCMEYLHSRNPACRFLIVVPSTALLDQWSIAVARELSLESADIGLLGGGNRPTGHEIILISVLDSVRKSLPSLLDDGDWCLIVDECHRAASESNRTILDGGYVATLGLSATPERQYDAWFEDYVVPALGPVVFRYSYEDAKRDGILAEFSLWNIKVPLTEPELEEIQKLNTKIRKEMGRLRTTGVAESDYLKRLLLARSRASQGAKSRISTTLALAEQWRGQRGLIFHESVNAAEMILELLHRKRHRARIYHSSMSDVVRRENLRLYIEGQIDILVSCRALDEGFDVPDTDFGIIAAASASRRQRTQRLGRILRPSPKSTHAVIASLYAIESEASQLSKEADHIDGVGQVRWFGAYKE